MKGMMTSSGMGIGMNGWGDASKPGHLPISEMQELEKKQFQEAIVKQYETMLAEEIAKVQKVEKLSTEQFNAVLSFIGKTDGVTVVDYGDGIVRADFDGVEVTISK